MGRPADLRGWAALASAPAAAGWVLDAAGLPSAVIFAGMLVGVAAALWRPHRWAVAPGAFTAAQAATGVLLGAYLKSSSLETLGHDWLPVLLVSAGTLGVTLTSGVLIARVTTLDRPTAALGTIAGGASGIVTMARDLGADERLVAFMQYLRVLIVVVLTPLLVALLFGAAGPHAGGGQLGGGASAFGDPRDWGALVALAVAGAALGALVRLPSATLLGPMILAGAATLSLPDGWFVVPGVVQELAFAAIGLHVGLGFTVDTVKDAGRLLVPVVVSILVLIALCAGLAVVLDATTAVSFRDAYLATTPGGLYAVASIAVGSGADTTFIVAVQSLRLVVMVLLAPAAVRWRVRRVRAEPTHPGYVAESASGVG